MSEFVGEAGYDTAGMVYDASGQTFRRIWNDRSGGHYQKVITNFTNPLTYYTNAIQDIRSGAYMFVCYNSGVQQVMELKSLYMSIVNPNLTSGGQFLPLFELWRITAVSGGGSGQTLLRADPGDTTSGINVMHQINALSGAGGTDKLLQWNMGPTVSGSVAVSGASPYILQSLVQVQNIFNNQINQIPSQTRELKQPILRSGFGLAIRQSVNAGYTQIISGQVFINAMWAITNSGDITTF